MAELSDAAFASMTRITVPDDIVALFTLVKVAPPAQFVVERQAPINLMIGPATRRDIDTTGMITLSADDVPDMMALVDLTQPGPFAAKTYRLGTYLGIRLDGKLIAMAGERLHLDGYTEVSAVVRAPGLSRARFAGGADRRDHEWHRGAWRDAHPACVRE